MKKQNKKLKMSLFEEKTSSEVLKKVLNFIQYHNAFTIALVLVFVFSATIFASEGARDTVIGEKIETKQGTDNSVIINKNLNSFDPRVTVISVTQDEKNYYVKYNFNTVGMKDNKWENLQKERILKVSKDALKDKDLGLYVQKELSQVIDNELVYLKEVQKAEREKGQTEILTTTEYTGLVGLVLNIKDKAFSDYNPVVVEPAKEIVSIDNNNFETDDINNNSKPLIGLGTANLNGITLYDQNSNTPFCISIIKGSIKTLSGECGSIASQEEPAVEEPIIEEPASVVEDPIIEQPVISEPAPVIEEPVIEEPAEESIIEEPVVEPVISEPAPVIEEPVIEEPVIEQPAVE